MISTDRPEMESRPCESLLQYGQIPPGLPLVNRGQWPLLLIRFPYTEGGRGREETVSMGMSSVIRAGFSRTEGSGPNAREFGTSKEAGNGK